MDAHRRHHSVNTASVPSPNDLTLSPLRPPRPPTKRYTVVRRSALSISIDVNDSSIDVPKRPETANILVRLEVDPKNDEGRLSPPKSPVTCRSPSGSRQLGLQAAVGSYRSRQASFGKIDDVPMSPVTNLVFLPNVPHSLDLARSHLRRATVSHVTPLCAPPSLDQLVQWKLKREEAAKVSIDQEIHLEPIEVVRPEPIEIPTVIQRSPINARIACGRQMLNALQRRRSSISLIA